MRHRGRGAFSLRHSHHSAIVCYIHCDSRYDIQHVIARSERGSYADRLEYKVKSQNGNYGLHYRAFKSRNRILPAGLAHPPYNIEINLLQKAKAPERPDRVWWVLVDIFTLLLNFELVLIYYFCLCGEDKIKSKLY